MQGDIIWDGDDIALTDGDDNIKQQCYLRSIADVGENPFFRTYGGKLFDYVSKPFSKENKAKAEGEARRLLLNVEGIEMVNKTEIILKEINGSLCKVLTAQFVYNGQTKSFNFNFGV